MKYLIIDLEATCSNDNSIRKEESEIIEIGAIIVEYNNGEYLEISEFSKFIKPMKHKISNFCTELTSITQSDVDEAKEFREVYEEFIEWLYKYTDSKIPFCSWGNYDKNQLDKECLENGIEFKLMHHINIKKLFQKEQNLRRAVSMKKALQIAGLQIDGTHHRGIDDAKNMRKLMPYIFGDEKIPRQYIGL